MNNFIQKWCDERHQGIDEEFSVVWGKIKTLEGRIWSILLLLVANLAGVITTLAMMLLKR